MPPGRGARGTDLFAGRAHVPRISNALVAAPDVAATDTGFAAERTQMVEAIAAMARTTAREVGRASFSEPVMQAMAKVPRHRFVAEEAAQAAYRNRPLPIGQGQTIRSLTSSCSPSS